MEAVGVAKKRERRPDYSVKHRLSSKPVEYTVVEGMEVDEFAVGSELVAPDVPVAVRVQQRGFFPRLEELIPQETELEVLITKDLEAADRWVREREKEEIEWVGCALHERPMDLKRGAQLAFIFNPDAITEGSDEAENVTQTEVDEGHGKTVTEEALDVHLGLRLDAMGEVELRKDSIYDIDSASPDFDPLLYDTDDREEQDIDDLYAYSSDEEDSELDDDENGDGDQEKDFLTAADPLGNERFDFFPEVGDELEAKDNGSFQRHGSSRPPVVYKVGNIIIEDRNPPQPRNRGPPTILPPKVFTHDAALASLWEVDGDQAEQKLLPENAVPIKKNVISLLTLCHGRHVLILQLRRMNAVGPAVYDLLYSKDIKKLSFNPKDYAWLLAPLGITLNEGIDLRQLLIEATERESFEDLPAAVQGLKDHQFVRILAGIDISDRQFYVEEWNHPLLCEREVACLAKEAFALYAMATALSRADRTHFFDMDIFVQNPLPPSFLDRVQTLPATTVRHLTLERGRFYEDMGKLLQGLSFDITVTVTRDPAVAEEWGQKLLNDGSVRIMGFNQEWVTGRDREVTAIFTVATEKEVLICQQLYMPWIPSELRNVLLWKHVRKYGPQTSLSIVKRNQRRLALRGFESLAKLLVDLSRVTKFKNLPKVLKDVSFGQLARLLVAPETEPVPRAFEGVRWDKPEFSDDEIEYQALRAWLGWALMHILTEATPPHLERFVAYLEGAEYVPRAFPIPIAIRERFSNLGGKTEEDSSAGESFSEKRVLLERLATQSEANTHNDLNHLFDLMLQTVDDEHDTSAL